MVNSDNFINPVYNCSVNLVVNVKDKHVFQAFGSGFIRQMKEGPKVNNRDNVAAQVIYPADKGSGVRHKCKFIGFRDFFYTHNVHAIIFSREGESYHLEIHVINAFFLFL